MLLDVQHIRKSYPGNDVLRDVTFHIAEKEKAALIGINGAGKSTLLKIITGEEEADGGLAVTAKDTKIGYLSQHQDYTGNGSIYRAVFEVNGTLLAAEDRLRTLEEEMGNAEGAALEAVMADYARTSESFERMNGYAYRSEVTGVLRGLGFTDEEFSSPASALSGGQKTRLSLARILLSHPDLLLLDEPTNHLDLEAVTWLEGYLESYSGACLIVSHDRYFLNHIVSRVIEIENGQSIAFSGSYDIYTQKKEQQNLAKMRAYLADQRRIAHEEAVIEKLRSFNREKSIRRAESREKKLSRITPAEKPAELHTDMRLSLTPAVTSGQDVLTIEGLAKTFPGKDLFRDVDLHLTRGDRVAVIGANGTGKSTFLKILMDILPADTGTVRFGANVFPGYYDQENQQLSFEKTIFEEISDSWPDLTNTRIRNVLAAFLFTGEDVFKRIGDLSGGERARVSLAKLMLSEANFLILDEPTNHLDIHSKTILEQALRSYTGTVLAVSHDRYFIDRIATSVLALENGTMRRWNGDYSYYLEKKREEKEAALPDIPEELTQDNEKARWQANKQRQAARRKLENDLRRTEDAVSRAEDRISKIDEALADPAVGSDPVRCADLARERASLEEELTDLLARWEELEEANVRASSEDAP